MVMFVELLQSTLEKPDDIKADIVIAADGVESNIANKAGLKTVNQIEDIASCAQYEMVGVDIDPNYLQIHHGAENSSWRIFMDIS